MCPKSHKFGISSLIIINKIKQIYNNFPKIQKCDGNKYYTYTSLLYYNNKMYSSHIEYTCSYIHILPVFQADCFSNKKKLLEVINDL